MSIRINEAVTACDLYSHNATTASSCHFTAGGRSACEIETNEKLCGVSRVAVKIVTGCAAIYICLTDVTANFGDYDTSYFLYQRQLNFS